MDIRQWKAARKKTRKIGQAGERAAAMMYEQKGCSVLLRNCKTRRAELDLIVRDGNTLVFAEVKTLFHRKNSKRLLKPGINLKLAQRRRIWHGAQAYLDELDRPHLPIRFDLVEVICGTWGPEKIFHHTGIFTRQSLWQSLRNQNRQRENRFY